MALFEELSRKGNTIIVVTHEEDIARQSRRIIRLRDGLIASDEMLVESRESGVEGHSGSALDPRPLGAAKRSEDGSTLDRP